MLVTRDNVGVKLTPGVEKDLALNSRTQRALGHAIRPEDVFENIDSLNDEIEETYTNLVQTTDPSNDVRVTIKEKATPVVPVKRTLSKKSELKQEVKQTQPQIKKVERKMDLEKELDQIVEKSAPEVKETSDKDQVLELISKLPDAPNERLLAAWKSEHGELHATVFSDKEIYLYTHLTRAMWSKVQEAVQRLQSVKNTVGEEELRETVVKHCMKWPVLSTEWKYNSRAGVVDALYQAIMLHSYFLTQQQIMAITVEI